MSSKNTGSRIRRQGSSFVSRSSSARGDLSKISSRELERHPMDTPVPKRQHSTKYKTLKESSHKDYPVTYSDYVKSSINLADNQEVGARNFDIAQKVIQFNSTARNVVGGFRAAKEGFITIRTSGGMFKKLKGEKRYISVENANIRILAEAPRDDQLEEEVESLLDIPFVELRAIHYPKDDSKEFRLVFNSHNETPQGGISYRPHTLILQASSVDVAVDWLKSILVGCINTVLFLNNIIKYLQDHTPNDKQNIEHFLRQTVDLSTIAKGLLSKDTISAQSSLSEFLSKNGNVEEGEFWHNMSYSNNMKLENDEYDEEDLSGLSLIQDEVATAISLGAIDFTDEFVPERRSSFRLPGKLTPHQRRTSVRARRAQGSSRSHATRSHGSRSNGSRSSGGKIKRNSNSSQSSSGSSTSGDMFVRRAGSAYRITSRLDQDI